MVMNGEADVEMADSPQCSDKRKRKANRIAGQQTMERCIAKGKGPVVGNGEEEIKSGSYTSAQEDVIVDCAMVDIATALATYKSPHDPSVHDFGDALLKLAPTVICWTMAVFNARSNIVAPRASMNSKLEILARHCEGRRQGQLGKRGELLASTGALSAMFCKSTSQPFETCHIHHLVCIPLVEGASASKPHFAGPPFSCTMKFDTLRLGCNHCFTVAMYMFPDKAIFCISDAPVLYTAVKTQLGVQKVLHDRHSRNANITEAVIYTLLCKEIYRELLLALYHPQALLWDADMMELMKD